MKIHVEGEIAIGRGNLKIIIEDITLEELIRLCRLLEKAGV